ncbi:MAG: hypothetical protein HXS54_16255 [Theionarchaea archaeon]|nr:hypothetical protein [Theionarchaea archaeon]
MKKILTRKIEKVALNGPISVDPPFPWREDEDHPKVTSKDDVTKLLAPHMMFLPQEEFRVILLNAKQKLIRVETSGLKLFLWVH